MATTHMSAGRRRRQRLRRTLLVATLLVVGGGAAGYAAWHDDEPASASADGHRLPVRAGGAAVGATAAPGPEPATSPRSTPTEAHTTDGKPSGSGGFAPVVTSRIPEPTASVALSAPVPGTTNMQIPAARAFERAFDAARAAGLSPQVRSAWRSAAYQQILFDRAVTRYGSETAASRWVLPPLESAHVKGYAVDVQPRAAAAWLEEHGAAYGICRTYDNEWWHFEYLATATCPPRQPTAAG